ncbi:MAG TPA: hypothetical protein VLZ33_01665 [Dysgonamonadaceae bacterium]|nr:hypothetical protein [Dysgonamonadaceae bacterium]
MALLPLCLVVMQKKIGNEFFFPPLQFEDVRCNSYRSPQSDDINTYPNIIITNVSVLLFSSYLCKELLRL